MLAPRNRPDRDGDRLRHAGAELHRRRLARPKRRRSRCTPRAEPAMRERASWTQPRAGDALLGCSISPGGSLRVVERACTRPARTPPAGISGTRAARRRRRGLTSRASPWRAMARARRAVTNRADSALGRCEGARFAPPPGGLGGSRWPTAMEEGPRSPKTGRERGDKRSADPQGSPMGRPERQKSRPITKIPPRPETRRPHPCVRPRRPPAAGRPQGALVPALLCRFALAGGRATAGAFVPGNVRQLHRRQFGLRAPSPSAIQRGRAAPTWRSATRALGRLGADRVGWGGRPGGV